MTRPILAVASCGVTGALADERAGVMPIPFELRGSTTNATAKTDGDTCHVRPNCTVERIGEACWLSGEDLDGPARSR